jgi:hypothetical protein
MTVTEKEKQGNKKTEREKERKKYSVAITSQRHITGFTFNDNNFCTDPLILLKVF